MERNEIPRKSFSFTKQEQNNLTKRFVCTSKVVFSGTSLELNIFISIFADEHFFLHFFSSYPYTLQFAVYIGISTSYFKYVIITDIEYFSRVYSRSEESKKTKDSTQKH
jgi:hypothetical protein